MCPIQLPSIPPETVQAVGTVFGRSNLAVVIADQSSHLFSDLEIGHRHNSSRTILRLFFQPAVVTLFQFVEELPDRRAAEATRQRIEWKYALRLPLNHPGLDPSALCEFRRLLQLDTGCRDAFQALLTRVQALDVVSDKDGLTWTADHVRTKVCNLSRVELLILRIYQALDVLATYQPERLRESALLSQYGRYRRRVTQPVSDSLQAQTDLLAEIGADMLTLMQVVENSTTRGPAWLHEMQALHQAWSQNFVMEGGQAKWRCQGCVSCTLD